jgi:hypothetical protein
VFDDELALPVDDPAYLAAFANHFSIDRNFIYPPLKSYSE